MGFPLICSAQLNNTDTCVSVCKNVNRIFLDKKKFAFSEKLNLFNLTTATAARSALKSMNKSAI